MDINPAPDRLVVRLTDAAPGVGATGQGEILAVGDEVGESPHLHYEIGDTVLFGRAQDVPVISVEDDDDLIVLSAADVLATLSGAGRVKIVEPARKKAAYTKESADPAPATAMGGATKLDEYIRRLRDLAK